MATRDEINDAYYGVQRSLKCKWPNANAGMNRAIIARLLKEHSVNELVECARFLRYEAKRYGHVYDMRRVNNMIVAWIGMGRPSAPGQGTGRREGVSLGIPAEYCPLKKEASLGAYERFMASDSSN